MKNKAAAYHEAGHAVLAAKSRYHSLVYEISIAQYGAGNVFVSVSRRKCKLAGKGDEFDPQTDKDVIRECAMILCAGYAAELLAEMNGTDIKPNRACADPDYYIMREQLKNAKLSLKYDKHESDAKALLIENWSLVQRLAEQLFVEESMDACRVLEFIEASDVMP